MGSNAVLVLGAGVSGLSTGVTLLKAGYPVTIWAKELPPNTTSNQAAALWFPYLCKPKERVDPWAKYSLNFFKQNLLSDSASGCSTIRVCDLYDQPVGVPWWADAVDQYKRLAKSDLPSGYVDGFETESIVMDTTVYMDYLVRWFGRLGGELVKKEIDDVQEAFYQSDIVINCTGLASRNLFNDQLVYPVRGQTVRVRANGFRRAILDDKGHNSLAYIIPRSNDIVLGGTAQANDWDLNIRASDREDILRKAAAIDPAFKDAEILSEGVGLRPARDTVRLEAEDFGGKTVIHNYGHGGAGFTLSWGCAGEVLQRMKDEG
ncbi:MAG: FAD-dependent oxidoreductase [Anaerolineales bacterium]